MKSVFVLAAAMLCTHAGLAATETKPADPKVTEQRLEEARKRLEQAAREVAELTGSLYADRVRDNVVFLSRNPNRAMLGIGIGRSGDDEVDAGVKVLSVSPGGPAADAGLKAGDIIVELNGNSLKRDQNVSPSEKLLAEMGKLNPGDEVTLRYLREGKSTVVKLKVDKLPQLARRELRMRIPGERAHFDHDFDFDRPEDIFILRGAPIAGLELVPLTPKLAQYFATEKGLLVVRAPRSAAWKLEDGDVLLDIDGRVPSDPRHAFRILGSYQPGEKVTLTVWRQKKKTALAVTVPEREERDSRPPRPPRPPREPSSPPV